MAKIALVDIVNLPAFEAAADLYYRATKMTVSFPDREGNIVFYPNEERSRFCQLIQSTKRGFELCQKSDVHAAEIALREGRPMFYTCHAGLIDVVVPVVVNDEKIGCFYSGQSLLSPPTPIGFQEVITRVAELKIDPDELWEAYSTAPLVDSYKLEMAVELLAIISGHLIQGQLELKRERELTRSAVAKAKLERNLREMELRLSQAQLNPHFLFNSLNLILGQALNENAEQTAHLVDELSTLLSNSLTSIGKMVSLKDEMVNAKAYVEIFRARFGKQIDLKTTLPRSLARVKVPALILQPLVENALVHGFPTSPKPFCIRVSAGENNGLVEIEVTDNGTGMTSQKFGRLANEVKSYRHHCKLTGLTGLSQRLRYYYSERAVLHLKQSSDGFSVTICLPVSANGLKSA